MNFRVEIQIVEFQSEIFFFFLANNNNGNPFFYGYDLL